MTKRVLRGHLSHNQQFYYDRLTFSVGDRNPIISLFNQKELNEPWILIQVTSKSVENGEVMDILRIQYGQHLAAILNI